MRQTQPTQIAKRRIGIYGGSFNPPTLAHLHLAQSALTQLHLDEVWLLVALQNPHKPVAGMADFEHRISMCRQMLAGTTGLHAIDNEQRYGNNETYSTLRCLRAEYPQHQFVWLMGSDNLINFHKWHGWQEIAAHHELGVFKRAGYDLLAAESVAAQTLRPEQWQFVDYGNDALQLVSATKLREMIANGQELTNIDPKVAAYIKSHALYRDAPAP